MRKSRLEEWGSDLDGVSHRNPPSLELFGSSEVELRDRCCEGRRACFAAGFWVESGWRACGYWAGPVDRFAVVRAGITRSDRSRSRSGGISASVGGRSGAG